MSKAKDRQFKQDELIFNVTEDLLIAMEDAGLTQSDLARALGKSKSYVNQVLSGARNMTLKTLSDLCFAIGVDPQVTFDKDAQVIPHEPIKENRQHDDWQSDNIIMLTSYNRRRKKSVKETVNHIDIDYDNSWATTPA